MFSRRGPKLRDGWRGQFLAQVNPDQNFDPALERGLGRFFWAGLTIPVASCGFELGTLPIWGDGAW